jgi:hypothetical protein
MLNPCHIASGEVLPFRLDLAKAHVFDAATGVSLRTL